jgi:hypothetical protein
MRVLYCSVLGLNPKANGNQIVNMVNAMSDIGHEVMLTCFKSARVNLNTNILRQNYWLGAHNISRYLVLPRLLILALRDKNIVIYTRDPFFLLVMGLLNNRLIFECHEPLLHLKISFLDKVYKRAVLHYSRRKPNFKVILISEPLKEHWLHLGIAPNVVQVLHDGYAKSHQFHGSSKIYDFTYIGSLYKNRKINRIIDLAISFPQCSFLIVGWPYPENLELINYAKINSVKNVEIKSRVEQSEAIKLMSKSRFLLGLWSWDVPTINFCSPLKLFEYCSSDSIVIVENYPPFNDVLERLRECVVTVNPEDFSDLKEAHKFCLNMPDVEYHKRVQSQLKLIEIYEWKSRCREIFYT